MPKSQAELEAPAKVYQVDAVVTSMDGLRDDISEIKELIKEMQKSVNGVATVGYVNGAIEKLKEELIEYIDKSVEDSEERVIAKFSPMQKEHEWVKYGAIGLTGVQLIVAGILYLLSQGGS